MGPPGMEQTTDRQSLISVLRESTDITYRVRTRALYSHLFVAALPLTVGWGKPGNLALVALLLAYTAVGIVSTRWYNTHPSAGDAAGRWVMWLHVQLVGLAVIYNLVFVNLARQGVPYAMDYLMLLSALFCAGAAASYQFLRYAAITFIISISLPQAVMYGVSDIEGGGVTAFLLVIFIVFMSSTSLDLHRAAMRRLDLTRQLKVAKEDAERLARTDELTGLSNRRAFLELGQALLAGARRDGRPLAVIMMDLDHFKTINDRYGHATGDAALAVPRTCSKRRRGRRTSPAGSAARSSPWFFPTPRAPRRSSSRNACALPSRHTRSSTEMRASASPRASG